MEYKEGGRIDQSNMEYRGPSRRRGGIAVGGGMGLIIALVALYFGIDPGSLPIDSGNQPPAAEQSVKPLKCDSVDDLKNNRDCRWPIYENSIQSYWAKAVDGYQPAKMVIFTGNVETACGVANSQVGPFYCPADRKVYLDPAFAEKLLQQLGAKGGDAAEAYIVAHEFGHHISNLTGVLTKAQQMRDKGPDSAQVRLELQADCYAGIWFHNTVKDPDSLIKAVTQDDLNRIIDAAKAVGDDHIQMKSSGGISPESWTHGSAKMRKHWVQKGFTSGDPNVCDTFNTNDLGG